MSQLCYTTDMAFCSIRVTDEEKLALERYAKFKNKSVSEVLKEAFFDKLEDEYDIRRADEAYEEFLNNPSTVTSKEMIKRYGLRTDLR